MALSDQDQAVLDEMELGLRARQARRADARREHKPPSHRWLIAAIGLLVAGLAATALGLLLQSKVGDGVGVIGFLLIVSATWTAARRASTLGRWMTTHINERTTSDHST